MEKDLLAAIGSLRFTCTTWAWGITFKGISEPGNNYMFGHIENPAARRIAERSIVHGRKSLVLFDVFPIKPSLKLAIVLLHRNADVSFRRPLTCVVR